MKKEIKSKIKELNTLCETLEFELIEENSGCSVISKSTVQEGASFAKFEYQSDEESAYRECNAFLAGLLAGARLLDKKAYHNIIAGR